ncbi:MAG: hypothetical protein K2W95_35975 [Candidatus Obscuribacterales bacterium]|nr:hypothetical protein [Candidatus Obscuribacterales bacterium]
MPVEELIQRFEDNATLPNVGWLDDSRSNAWGRSVALPTKEYGMLDPERNIPTVMADVHQQTVHGLSWPTTVEYGGPALSGIAGWSGAYFRTDKVRWAQFPDQTGLTKRLTRDGLGSLAAVGVATLINRQIDKHFFAGQATDIGSCAADLVVAPVVACTGLSPLRKTLALVSVHTLGKVVDSFTQTPALYEGPSPFAPSMLKAFQNDWNSRSKETLNESISRASQIAATRPEVLRYQLNHEAQSLFEQRYCGAMAIAYADSQSKSVALKNSGLRLNFKSELDLGGNAARYYNLADRYLDGSLNHITDSARNGSRQHIDEKRAIDETIKTRVQEKLSVIYGPHDLKDAYKTIKVVLPTHVQELTDMADKIALQVSSQPAKPANPEFVAKLARDGALMRYALCEHDMETGNMTRSAQHLDLAQRMLKKAKDLGYAPGNLEQLTQIEEGLKLWFK